MKYTVYDEDGNRVEKGVAVLAHDGTPEQRTAFCVYLRCLGFDGAMGREILDAIAEYDGEERWREDGNWTHSGLDTTEVGYKMLRSSIVSNRFLAMRESGIEKHEAYAMAHDYADGLWEWVERFRERSAERGFEHVSEVVLHRRKSKVPG